MDIEIVIDETIAELAVPGSFSVETLARALGCLIVAWQLQTGAFDDEDAQRREPDSSDVAWD